MNPDIMAAAIMQMKVGIAAVKQQFELFKDTAYTDAGTPASVYEAEQDLRNLERALENFESRIEQ